MLVDNDHFVATFLQRFIHKDLPLLKNLAAHFERPSILHPTVVEVASGYWDLRQMTEEDFGRAGIARPFPTNDDRAFGSIGDEREARWRNHVVEVIKAVAKAFPGTQGLRDGPVISWRTMHHPKRNSASWSFGRSTSSKLSLPGRLHALLSRRSSRGSRSQDDARASRQFSCDESRLSHEHGLARPQPPPAWSS